MATAEPADAELPKALIKRIVKSKLSEIEAAQGGDASKDFNVNKDALLAFAESGKLFIHYLTATANDVCKDAKRQTISADDVLTALDDLEFGELVGPLKEALEAFKAENREKNRKKAEQTKKRKSDKLGGGAAAAASPAAAEGVESPEAGAAARADEAAAAAPEAEAAAPAREPAPAEPAEGAPQAMETDGGVAGQG